MGIKAGFKLAIGAYLGWTLMSAIDKAVGNAIGKSKVYKHLTEKHEESGAVNKHETVNKNVIGFHM